MLGKKVSEENLQSILDLEQRALGRISPEKLEHLGLAAWGLDGFSLRLMGPKLSVNPPPPLLVVEVTKALFWERLGGI